MLQNYHHNDLNKQTNNSQTQYKYTSNNERRSTGHIYSDDYLADNSIFELMFRVVFQAVNAHLISFFRFFFVGFDHELIMLLVFACYIYNDRVYLELAIGLRS